MKRFLWIGLWGTLFAVVGCQSPPSSNVQGDSAAEAVSEPSAQASPKDCANVHWSYHDDATGPERWKDLCADYAPCGGRRQSPIDIVTADAVPDPELSAPEFRYRPVPLHIVNNGHTIQVNVPEGLAVVVNGKEYPLLQFHFHALSEHTLDGTHFPLEIHLVHRRSDTELAVIGVMIAEGEAHPFFTQYLEDLPAPGAEVRGQAAFDLTNWLPADRGYYHYAGSLTTPPCSEVVAWYVMKEPVYASKTQIERMAELLQGNYRPVQPLYGRTVRRFEE